MCYVGGTFYIDGGYRPCIAKKGHKWTYIMYLRGSGVRCKRLKNRKTGIPKPIVGMKSYSLQQLACEFLRKKSALGTTRHIPKKAEQLLNTLIDQGHLL